MKNTVYACYLADPERHSNAMCSHPGFGATKAGARENALYWANQWPWTRTVPLSRAPLWVKRFFEEESVPVEATKVGCVFCGKHPTKDVTVAQAEFYYCGAETGHKFPTCAEEKP